MALPQAILASVKLNIIGSSRKVQIRVSLVHTPLDPPYCCLVLAPLRKGLGTCQYLTCIQHAEIPYPPTQTTTSHKLHPFLTMNVSC